MLLSYYKKVITIFLYKKLLIGILIGYDHDTIFLIHLFILDLILKCSLNIHILIKIFIELLDIISI